MKAQQEKKSVNKNPVPDRESVSNLQGSGVGAFRFVDNRKETFQMQKLKEIEKNKVDISFFKFIDNRSEALKQRRLQETLVVQKVKKIKPDHSDDSEVELFSDLDESDESEQKAIKLSYKNNKILNKSKQMERVKELRKRLKTQSSKKGNNRFIKATIFQKILAELNTKYSSQNTTAIGIGSDSKDNQIVTKMGGVNVNYLGRLINANVIVVKEKSAKNKNTHHAEKELAARRAGKKIFRRIIIDKRRCSVCQSDNEITNSANIIRDGSN